MRAADAALRRAAIKAQERARATNPNPSRKTPVTADSA